MRERESIILFSLDQPMTLGKPWCPRPASRPARLVCHCWRAGEASIETGSPTSPTYTCSFWPHRHIHASPPGCLGDGLDGGFSEETAPPPPHMPSPRKLRTQPRARIFLWAGWISVFVCVLTYLCT